MTINPAGSVDWGRWKASWEARMDYFVPDRPGLIGVILDVIEEVLPPDLIAIELGSGPGSLAGPVLDRFPAARCLAVDLDPVMIAMGRAVLAEHGDRIRWEQVDLRAGGWADRARSAVRDWARPIADPGETAAGLRPAAPAPGAAAPGQHSHGTPAPAHGVPAPPHGVPAAHGQPTPAGSTAPGGPFDAVLTLSALHHLAGEDLIRVYRQAADLLRPGGVLINGDFLPFGPDQPTLGRISDAVNARRRGASHDTAGHTVAEWWDRLRAEPGTEALFADRDRLIPTGQSAPKKPLHDLHLAALRDAGFAEIGTVWQNLDKRVVVGCRL